MTGITQDFRHALRSLVRAPGFALAAIITLGLGIGATTAAFSVVDSTLLRPLPWRDADRLVTIWTVRPQWRDMPALAASWDKGILSWPNFRDLQEHSRVLEQVGVWSRRAPILAGTVNEVTQAMLVSSSFLPMLGVKPHLGRFFTPTEDEQPADSVVISHEAWVRRFGGDPGLLGHSVTLDGVRRTIVGVLPPGFVFQDPAPEFVLPFGNAPQRDRSAGNSSYRAVGKLRSGISVGDALLDVESILRGAENPARLTARLELLTDTLIGASRRPLWMLFGAAGLLLLIACANVAGLVLGEAGSRRQEVAIRTALGASRMVLVRGMLAESMVLACAGTVLGVAVAMWLTPSLIALAPASLPHMSSVGLDRRVLVFSIGLAILTTALFGMGPAVALSHTAADGLREGRTVARRQRGALVMVEIALAFVLLVSASLFGETVIRLASEPVGFDAANLLVATIRHPVGVGESALSRAESSRLLEERLAGLPGVVSIGGAASLPFAGGYGSNRIEIEGEPSGEAITAARQMVTPGYFMTMRVPLVKGRAFQTGEQNLAVVSESFERQYLRSNGIGRRFRFNLKSDEWYRIVGVVGETRQRRLSDATGPTFYVPHTGTVGEFVLRTSNDPALSMAAVHEAVRSHDPRLVVTKIDAMQTLIRRTIASEEFRASLAGFLGGTALVLALTGIYALLSRSVTDRAREIGVRMALGASPSAILRLIVAQGGLPVLFGVLLGAPLSFASARLMSSMLYGVVPTAPHTFVVVAGALIIVSLGATALPACRAARVDPLVALRYE
jgi:putative ABC transport system permease protein